MDLFFLPIHIDWTLHLMDAFSNSTLSSEGLFWEMQDLSTAIFNMTPEYVANYSTGDEHKNK